jgi:hypothetical protein
MRSVPRLSVRRNLGGSSIQFVLKLRFWKIELSRGLHPELYDVGPDGPWGSMRPVPRLGEAHLAGEFGSICFETTILENSLIPFVADACDGEGGSDGRRNALACRISIIEDNVFARLKLQVWARPGPHWV